MSEENTPIDIGDDALEQIGGMMAAALGGDQNFRELQHVVVSHGVLVAIMAVGSLDLNAIAQHLYEEKREMIEIEHLLGLACEKIPYLLRDGLITVDGEVTEEGQEFYEAHQGQFDISEEGADALRNDPLAALQELLGCDGDCENCDIDHGDGGPDFQVGTDISPDRDNN